MQKQKNYRIIMASLMAFIVIFLVIGIVFLTGAGSVLNKYLAGSKVNSWSVRFDPDSYQLAEGSLEPSNLAYTDTNLAFGAKLEKPGDYVAFQTTLINDGDYGAALNAIALSPVPEEYAGKIKYTVSFDGKEYTPGNEGKDLNLGFPAGGAGRDATVRVEHTGENDETSELDFTTSFVFVQDN